MTLLTLLRQLVDQQQFDLLKLNALACWQDTAELAALPLLALASAQLGERAAALETATQAVAHLDALDLDGRVDLAGAYCVMQRLDEAVALLAPALGVDPDHPLAMARLAWCRLQQGDLATARALYQRSAACAPHRLPVWSALAHLCLDAGDADAAQAALTAAIAQLQAQHAILPAPVLALFTHQLRGLQLAIWLQSAQLARAEQWLDERRSSLPEDDWVALIIGYATLLAGHDCHADAEEALRAARQHYPDNLALVSQLAELAQLQGRSSQAIHLLRRAIALATQQDSSPLVLWVRLSAACLQHSTVQARQAAEKALELAAALAPDATTPEGLIRQWRWQAKNALAQVDSQEQHFAAAETQFRAVLDENPYFLPALQGLGQQQMQRGKIDEAIALFERVKAIDPAKGYTSLINARQFPEDDATLERLEKLAHQPSLEGSARAGILFQLAAVWEKRKAFDRAFALAKEANAASRKFLHYDPKAHRQHCARIRHAFPSALYQHRAGLGLDSRLPLFVLGMPRSGTTLVEQIIAGHSQIFGAGELGLIPQRIQGLNRWERHVGSGRVYPDCIDDLDRKVTQGIAQGILDELRELAATDKPEACHVVDKLPHNFENIGLIKFLFPQARIISVRRDPRDIALSNYFTDYQAKHGGMGFAYDLTWIGEQLADHNLLMHHWHQIFPGEILEINYEDVVADTEAIARQLLTYIGVAWEPQVLAFNALDRPVKTASVWQVRQPIYRSSTAKWKRYQPWSAPLIAGTNAKITWEPIDMLTLPAAGMFTDAVAHYTANQWDEAEYGFKRLLHHLPDHAAANFMLGLIYMHKGHSQDAIELMEKGYALCPWNPHWRKDLSQAYIMNGQPDKAEALQKKSSPSQQNVVPGNDIHATWPVAFDEIWHQSEGKQA